MSYVLQKNISQLFIEEVSKKGFNHTSIAEIMKLSNTRRQTFYDNFIDKYDLLEWTVKSMMEDNIESNIDYLGWEEIIALVFYNIELNHRFYKSIIESQNEVDIIDEISQHIMILLLHILKKKGCVKDEKAQNFIEIYCWGITYTMTNNLFKNNPKEYDELTKKVVTALQFSFKNY